MNGDTKQLQEIYAAQFPNDRIQFGSHSALGDSIACSRIMPFLEKSGPMEALRVILKY